VLGGPVVSIGQDHEPEGTPQCPQGLNSVREGRPTRNRGAQRRGVFRPRRKVEWSGHARVDGFEHLGERLLRRAPFEFLFRSGEALEDLVIGVTASDALIDGMDRLDDPGLEVDKRPGDVEGQHTMIA
jgi:hypothetical protein